MAVYIEYHLARHAQGLPDATDGKKSERLLTNALGVLNEQGVYALFLYLHAEKDAVAKKIGAGILKFLADREIHADVAWSKDFRQANGAALLFDDRTLFTKLQTLCRSRDDLFYAHGLLEQLLTYARYHAKALPDKKKRNATEQEKTEPEPTSEATPEAAPEPQLEIEQKVRTTQPVPAPQQAVDEETLEAAPEAPPLQPVPVSPQAIDEEKPRSPRVLGRVDPSQLGSGSKKR
jgi:hypothetical protein